VESINGEAAEASSKTSNAGTKSGHVWRTTRGRPYQRVRYTGARAGDRLATTTRTTTTTTNNNQQQPTHARPPRLPSANPMPQSLTEVSISNALREGVVSGMGCPRVAGSNKGTVHTLCFENSQQHARHYLATGRGLRDTESSAESSANSLASSAGLEGASNAPKGE
jgi:hypothetical protein